MTKGPRPIRLAFYNHKGGVGKTTLTMNLAAALSEHGHSVLLADTDPQCNLSAYLIDGDVLDDLLDRSDGAKGKTLWTGLKPIVEADGDAHAVDPMELGIDGMFLLPGDIRLSEFERVIEDAIGDAVRRRARGYRATTALSSLVDRAAAKVKADYIFYDTGPNIGPLNELILMDVDYFIVPCAFDLFSLRAVKSVGRTIANWVSEWSNLRDIAPDDAALLRGHPRFAGYVGQRFKTYGGDLTQGATKFAAQLNSVVRSDIVEVLKKLDKDLVPLSGTRLPSVKDFSALVIESHKSGKPLWEVDIDSSYDYMKDEAESSFGALAEAIEALPIPK